MKFQALALAIVCTVLQTVAQAQHHYSIIDIGTLGGPFPQSEGFDINESGEVAGTSYVNGDGTPHAVLFDANLNDLGTLGGSWSTAEGISNNGYIAGNSYMLGNMTQHAFRFFDGVMEDLGTLGRTYSYGYGVNSMGHVTGYVVIPDQRAFFYDGTTMHLLADGEIPSWGTDINELDQIAGYAQTSAGIFAYFYDGMIHILGALPGGSNSEGMALNDHGHVVGYSNTTNDYYHAFLHDGVSMQDLGTLGGNESFAKDINNLDQVVGLSQVPNGAGRAFLYSTETGMVDLNTLIDPLSGWTLIGAEGINDRGQVTGWGLIDDEIHGFILSPIVPEPSSVSLITLALLSLTARRYFRG
jgi:probable HAF family extracellular repeat protein